ncbi:hypothetical protein KUTeg_002390, partial [Tegillarca granosa]
MDTFKVLNNTFHVKVGSQFRVQSNFTFKLKWEIYHPSDTGYVVDLTREDNVQGTAFFKTSDISTNKDFMAALNRSFTHGGLLCNFRPQEIFEIVSQRVREMREKGNHTKTALVVAGLQKDLNCLILNQDQIFNINTGEMVKKEICPIAWTPEFNMKMMAKEDVMRYVQEPISVVPLVVFIDRSREILKEVIGPAILAWSAMYGLNFYNWLIDTTRNFNLPILYGQPMAGKTLIASCAAWLNGCTDIHIASRCTPAFITQWLKSSTMPFVWDDPSSSEDVGQLTIDLGCRAIRGKSTDDPRTPQTGCLELESCAKAASAAFPLVMKAISSITEEDLFSLTRTLRESLEAELRIVQGIAFPLLIAKKALAGIEASVIRGEALAFKKEALALLWAEPQENFLRKNGGTFNKTTRLNGKPTKNCTSSRKRRSCRRRQAVEEQAVEEQAVEEQAVEEQAVEEQAVEEQAVEEQVVEAEDEIVQAVELDCGNEQATKEAEEEIVLEVEVANEEKQTVEEENVAATPAEGEQAIEEQ